jgi:hypothetical protein
MNGLKLYQISDLLESVIKKIEINSIENDGEISSDFMKVLNVAKFIKGLNAESDAIKNEIDKLQLRRKRIDRESEWLKNYIDLNCEDKTKIEDSTTVITWRKSESIKIFDEAIIPKDYIKEKIETSIDKIKIKEAIKSGANVSGAEIETNFNLQIK